MRTVAAYLLMFVFAVSFSNCSNKEKSPFVPDNAMNPDLVKNPESPYGLNKSVKVPEFSFKDEVNNFGMIVEGEKVTHAFTFTNTGTADLIISNASASCGCTVPEFPKEPIPPGKMGTINVIFNSTGKDGYQRKEIMVKANTIPNVKKLYITGTVIKKKK